MKSIPEIRESNVDTVADSLAVVDGSFQCAKCDYDLGPTDENFKEHLALRESKVEDLGPLWIDPDKLIDDEVVVREFFCPNCALRMSMEVANVGDHIVADARLD